MTQLAYNLYMPEKFPGLIADARTHIIETAAAFDFIPFGRAVVQVVGNDDQVRLPYDPANVLRGIATSTWNVIQLPDAPPTEDPNEPGWYQGTDPVNVLRQGVIWVYVTIAVSKNDSAYYVYTGAGDEGKFKNNATDAIAIPNSQFKTSASAGELAILEINLP